VQESRKLATVVSERNFEFLLWNEVFLSGVAERINEMKSQNLGLCSRYRLVKLFSCNGAFREMAGKVPIGP
jgi:hypothetical protein